MKRNVKGIKYRKTETRLGHDLTKRADSLRCNEASGLALKFIHPLLDIADFSEQVSAKVLPNPFRQYFLIPFASVEGSPPLNLLYAYGYNNVLSCFLANWVLALAAGNTQFGINIAQVKFHGTQRNAKGKSDLLVALALNQKFDDLLFTFAVLDLGSHSLSVMQRY